MFFRKRRQGETHSIERLFGAIMDELPRERFVVRRFTCPFHSRGVIRRILLILWASMRQGDINHVTGDIDFIVLLMRRSRTVLTIHDLGTLHRLTGWRRRLYLLFWLRLPLARAGKVTVVSECTRAQIETNIATTGKSIYVIPNCVTVPVRVRPKPFERDRPRILQVGTGPNKNLERAIAALVGIRCVLVIVGRLSPAQRDLLERYGACYENHVGVSEVALLDQYDRADLVLFVSTYEGFGLPILEAQASGRPIVTSDREPMCSVSGPGAIHVDPDDIKAIRRAILALISDDVLRRKLVEEGFRNVRSYKPAAIAGEYATIYTTMRDDKGS